MLEEISRFPAKEEVKCDEKIQGIIEFRRIDQVSSDEGDGEVVRVMDNADESFVIAHDALDELRDRLSFLNRREVRTQTTLRVVE